MSLKEKDMTLVLERWVPIFMIICTLIGILLGSIILYYVQGDLPYEVITGGVIAATVLIIIQVLKIKFKKNNLPETDERVAKNIFRYFAYTSHVFLAILFIALAVVTVLGKEVISIFYLWILFFAYIWTVGIGTLILKRR